MERMPLEIRLGDVLAWVLPPSAVIGVAGGLWAQPKMRALHVTKYFGRTSEQQMQAGREFAAWHTASEAANLLVIGGLVWYLWRVSREQEQPRFVSFSKIRG